MMAARRVGSDRLVWWDYNLQKLQNAYAGRCKYIKGKYTITPTHLNRQIENERLSFLFDFIKF